MTSPRVLHVVENMHRGAVENWLVRMYAHAKMRDICLDWTFYCMDGRPGDLDDTVISLGATIIYSPVVLSDVRAFVRSLRREIVRGGYDVVHAHHDLASALYLLAAIGLPVRRRITHIHNAEEAVPVAVWKQRILREPFRHVCLKLSDRVVGISNHVLDKFIRQQPRRPGRDVVHYYGVDPRPFLEARRDRDRFRRVHDLPPDARIAVFASRLVPEKNPTFFIEILDAMMRKEPSVYGVIVGSGGEESSVLDLIRKKGIGERVRMLGWQTNVAAILVNCDWFILPRPDWPKEGLGLAVVEAQLAGLKVLVSNGILDDAFLPGSAHARLPVCDNADEWARAALELDSEMAPTPQDVAAVLRTTAFDLDYALIDLMALHA